MDYEYDAPELGNCGLPDRSCAECAEDVFSEWRGVQLCERHYNHRVQDARRALEARNANTRKEVSTRY